MRCREIRSNIKDARQRGTIDIYTGIWASLGRELQVTELGRRYTSDIFRNNFSSSLHPQNHSVSVLLAPHICFLIHTYTHSSPKSSIHAIRAGRELIAPALLRARSAAALPLGTTPLSGYIWFVYQQNPYVISRGNYKPHIRSRQSLFSGLFSPVSGFVATALVRAARALIRIKLRNFMTAKCSVKFPELWFLNNSADEGGWWA